jgi:hypothetical protein
MFNDNKEVRKWASSSDGFIDRNVSMVRLRNSSIILSNGLETSSLSSRIDWKPALFEVRDDTVEVAVLESKMGFGSILPIIC